MILSPSSTRRLAGVHPDLVRVVMTASGLAGALDIIVTEGLRSAERQALLVSQGKSRTQHSRHLTGHAVDLAVVVDGEVSWEWPIYERLAAVVFRAADLEGVPVEWGGHWTTLRDGPHFQLPWDKYPVPAPPAEPGQVVA